MKTIIGIVIILALVSGSVWWAWQDSAAEVVVETVKQGEIKHSSPGRVKVLPKRRQVLKSLRPGRVKSVLMPPNSPSRKVSKGEIVIQLVTRDVELALQEIQTGLRAAEARLQAPSDIALKLGTEKRELEDFRKLTDEGRFPLADFRKKEDSVKGLEAQLELEKISLNEQVESARNKEAQALRHLEELSIPSPFEGILTEIMVSPGDTLSSGEPLGVLQSKEHLVQIALNEEDFQDVEIGQSVAISFLSEGNDAIFRGRVSSISDAIDPAGNRRYLFVDMEAGNERFSVGSTGEAEIIKSVKKDAVLVPRKALVGESVCVWKDGVIEVRKVKIGSRNLLTAEVLDGLELGESVVVDTPHLFRDGQRARLAETNK